MEYVEQKAEMMLRKRRSLTRDIAEMVRKCPEGRCVKVLNSEMSVNSIRSSISRVLGPDIRVSVVADKQNKCCYIAIKH